MKILFGLVFFALVGYFSGFYYVTDPADMSFYKTSAAYAILAIGFIFIYKESIPIWFYFYIGVVYLVYTVTGTYILNLIK